MLAAFALPASASAFTLPSLPSLPGFSPSSTIGGATSKEDLAGVVRTGVCLKLAAVSGTIASRVKSATANYEQKAEERSIKNAALESQEGANVRSETDKRLAAYFKTLDAKAGADAQKKQAVAAFKSRVMKALDARRSAVDAAAKAYQSGASAVARGRTEAVRKLAEDMRLELAAAVDAADSRCRVGTDSASIRADLAKSLAAIERTYAAKLLDRGSVAASLMALSEANASALSSANAAFSAEIDAASQALNSVLQ